MFWNRLIRYGLLQPTTEYEDDSLVNHGFGITDVVKVPREFGNEPSDEEYQAGIDRILQLIAIHNPQVVVFVYKGVLDRILKLRFGLREKSDYGFNSRFDSSFGTRVFVFPMPGTPCKSAQAREAMQALVQFLEV